MESLADLLHRTINTGAPLYNDGKPDACYAVYQEAVQLSLQQDMLRESAVGQKLREASESAQKSVETDGDYSEAAWILRRCFDEILSGSFDATTTSSATKSSAALTASLKKSREEEGDVKEDSLIEHASGYWQDDAVTNKTPEEKGQAISDTVLILYASISTGSHRRAGKTYQDCFPATRAIELLTQLGLAASRKQAVAKLDMLLTGGLIRPVSQSVRDDDGKMVMPQFKDGTHLYGFPDREELRAALESLDRRVPSSSSSDDGAAAEETREVLRIALQRTLEVSEDEEQGGGAAIFRRRGSIGHRHSAMMGPEYQTGAAIARFLQHVEPVLAVRDRKYNFRTYEQCFVGSEAVTAIQNSPDIDLTDRAEIVQRMNTCLQTGLLHHVTRDHEFEDRFLFYRVTPAADVKQQLDSLQALPAASAAQTTGSKVRHTALVQRYKQFGAVGFNITEILNSFFGCQDESGWDVVDLQNWRNNMKRWGFGRREDQDDEMVDKLSPLVANIDPDQWDATIGDDEEWDSPFGILAQIALFDQVPRSAFRGTPDAFKWDHLAIRATKVAIEKGYFEEAFQSTLNRFLLLLPLEHSEDWEDQKLGVRLLLEMLSTVAIQDEGLSSYEIVKRLEFSKRLTTAFLEHAQVIAKFERYPHRNRAQGRTTTLEERIWLASDLVPRWAKSQNPEEEKNIIQLPVIPLKRFTRGR
jgi:uncharacterized protein (DUF924 family)